MRPEIRGKLAHRRRSKQIGSRIELEARAIKALPDTGFAAVTGVFIRPDRMQQFADYLLKLQKGSAFGIVANEVFQLGFLVRLQVAEFQAVATAIKQTGGLIGKRSGTGSDLKGQFFHVEAAVGHHDF